MSYELKVGEPISNSKFTTHNLGTIVVAKKGVHLFIEGWVQGVFFRHYTREKAKELGVTGWVRNLPDGRVEVMAEGEEEIVDSLVKWCHQGPPSARVYDVECMPQEYTGKFKDFSIRY